jgi:hypothetical protein
MWNVKVPSKVRVLVWRLAQMSLPTGNLRMRQNMADTNVCTICNAAKDSWRHLLLNCNTMDLLVALMDEDLTEHIISN